MQKALKSMMQTLSSPSSHSMIQHNLKQPKKQAKSVFAEATKKGQATFSIKKPSTVIDNDK